MKIYSLTKIHKLMNETDKDSRKISADKSTLSQTKSNNNVLWKKEQAVGKYYKALIRPYKKVKLQEVDADGLLVRASSSDKILNIYDLHGGVVVNVRCDEGWCIPKIIQIECTNRCGQTIKCEIESLIINGEKVKGLNEVFVFCTHEYSVRKMLEIETQKMELVNIELTLKLYYEKFGYYDITKTALIEYKDNMKKMRRTRILGVTVDKRHYVECKLSIKE